jgi:hypothetical protein
VAGEKEKAPAIRLPFSFLFSYFRSFFLTYLITAGATSTLVLLTAGGTLALALALVPRFRILLRHLLRNREHFFLTFLLVQRNRRWLEVTF